MQNKQTNIYMQSKCIMKFPHHLYFLALCNYFFSMMGAVICAKHPLYEQQTIYLYK